MLRFLGFPFKLFFYWPGRISNEIAYVFPGAGRIAISGRQRTHWLACLFSSFALYVFIAFLIWIFFNTQVQNDIDQSKVSVQSGGPQLSIRSNPVEEFFNNPVVFLETACNFIGIIGISGAAYK